MNQIEIELSFFLQVDQRTQQFVSSFLLAMLAPTGVAAQPVVTDGDCVRNARAKKNFLGRLGKAGAKARPTGVSRAGYVKIMHANII
jgi:hypothetical protein